MKDGWVEKKLVEVGDTQTGTTPSTKEKDNYGDFIPFVKPSHFNKDGSICSGESMLSEKGLKSSRMIDKYSTLMVCIGATIGKTGFTEIPVTSNQQINALTPKDDYEPKYFYYALLTDSFFEKVIHASSQATLPIINKSKWGNLTVPIPLKKEEQKRIVAKLDQCFEAIGKAKVNVEKNLNNAKELFQSKLNEIFSQKGDGWTEKKLGEVCEKTTNIKWQENQGTEYEYIDLTAVSRDLLEITGTVSVNSTNAPSRAKKIIKTDDVIFATTRPTLKRVAKITNQFDNQICSTGFVVLRCKKDVIEHDIIFYFLQTDMFMDRMESTQRGTSYPAVTDKDVKETVISFPNSLSKQNEIVKQLDELKEQTQSLESNYQQELDALDELKKSILQKAFNGEL